MLPLTVESTTAMAGSGCNVQLFTTGLGTPTGDPISTVVKIASNTNLANRLPDIIDFDAGTIISGEKHWKSWVKKYWNILLGYPVANIIRKPWN